MKTLSEIREEKIEKIYDKYIHILYDDEQEHYIVYLILENTAGDEAIILRPYLSNIDQAKWYGMHIARLLYMNFEEK